MSDKKLNISKEGLKDLLSKIYFNTEEERNLALDRYRAQDNQIHTIDDFIATGKDTVAFLKLASDRTNSLKDLAEKMNNMFVDAGSKEDEGNSSGEGVSDDIRKQIEESLKAQSDKKQDEDMSKDLD